MKQKGNVGLIDVARLAGCAPATVSRRLNSPEKVSEDVIKSIDAAISQLGYVRNASARALRANRSKLVGAVIPTLRHSIYAEMLAGLQQTLANHGFALIHTTSDYDIDEEYRQVMTLVERGVEAIVLVGTRHRSKTFTLLKEQNVNLVVTYAIESDFKLSSVGFDNRRAAELAADRLYELGHRRFTMLAGVTHNNDRAQLRVDGFVDRLKSKGVEATSIEIREAPYVIEEGRAAMEDVLAKHPDVTGVFCGSDILAVGALRACRVRGLSVPEDISIIGFDNLEIAAFTEPPLSTLDVPAFGMGSETANHIMLSDPKSPTVRKVELDVKLLDRGTTAIAPKPVSLPETPS
nr:substrate-binding domain-containing protein [cf. Phormidesmis sp. LEGE 11477]